MSSIKNCSMVVLVVVLEMVVLVVWQMMVLVVLVWEMVVGVWDIVGGVCGTGGGSGVFHDSYLFTNDFFQRAEQKSLIIGRVNLLRSGQMMMSWTGFMPRRFSTSVICRPSVERISSRSMDRSFLR